jgi:dTDP-4-amino-4,6-dideoxygalactose transaminase|tara:strand:+ start:1901 stop:2974 length:1074 start_codon:yes stop_codon:yes gene_type:complete
MTAYDAWDREYQENKDAYLKIFDDFMSQMNYENNEEWERDFSERVGRKHCVSVASATDALHFTLLAHDIGKGDEVLVTDFSWISSSACTSMVGATPVFCDIDLDSYHISMDSVRRMYSDKVKAIIYPHLFGNITDTTELRQFCKEKNILFIEDAAQAFGSSLHGVRAGTIGDCSVYSFNSNKVIAGINGGGVVLTDNEDIAKRVKMIRRHGKDKDFSILGYNSRMYVLNAMIIKQRLKNVDRNQERRQEIAKKYNNAFSDLDVVTQTMSNGLNHNFHKYVIRFKNKDIRNKVKKALNASIHYETPLSANSMYANLECRSDACTQSKTASDTVLSLPIHAWLTEDEVISTINNVKNAL